LGPVWKLLPPELRWWWTASTVRHERTHTAQVGMPALGHHSGRKKWGAVWRRTCAVWDERPYNAPHGQHHQMAAAG
jgi:hypothetical protein